MSPVVSTPLAEATSAPAALAELPVARRGRLRAPVELEVIIPAYNESARLPETLRQSVAYLNERPWQSRIVVVDNGSVDETAADARVAAVATDKVDVVVIGCSRAGKGAAVRRGLLTSTSPLVGFYDADLATPLETLQATVEALQSGADAVIASRHVPGASFVVPQRLRRRAGGRAGRREARRRVRESPRPAVRRQERSSVLLRRAGPDPPRRRHYVGPFVVVPAVDGRAYECRSDVDRPGTCANGA